MQKKQKKPLSKGAKAVLIILIVVMAGVAGFCGYKLLGISASYKQANDTYQEIDNMIADPEKYLEDFNLEDLDDFEGFENMESGTEGENKDIDVLNNDRAWKLIYAKLKEQYPDLVGYIRQDGIMSYPLVQAEDNDKYLRHMINMEYNVAGTIFVDSSFKQCLDGPYSIIYGHNMNDNSMFGSLKHYESEDWYKEHPTFDLYIDERHYRYYVFSSFVSSASGEAYSYRYNENDPDADAKFMAFATKMRDSCPYETNAPEITPDSHVVLLSTCVPWGDYSVRRVVFLVRGEELSALPSTKPVSLSNN